MKPVHNCAYSMSFEIMLEVVVHLCFAQSHASSAAHYGPTLLGCWRGGASSGGEIFLVGMSRPTYNEEKSPDNHTLALGCLGVGLGCYEAPSYATNRLRGCSTSELSHHSRDPRITLLSFPFPFASVVVRFCLLKCALVVTRARSPSNTSSKGTHSKALDALLARLLLEEADGNRSSNFNWNYFQAY